MGERERISYGAIPDDFSDWTDADLYAELARRSDGEHDCAPFMQELLDRGRPISPPDSTGGTYRLGATLQITNKHSARPSGGTR